MDNSLILIVDDNPHNLQVLAAVVNECNYKSGFAMNGQQALDFLEENIPDLILLDVMMPDMNGFDVCKKIKSNKDLIDIPIIFLTAKSEKEDIIKGFESGGVDYVTKPFNNTELKMRIKTHLELKHSKNKLIELNKNLEKANATKDKFFSIIAHDLRGPMGSMIQYFEILIDEVEETENKEIIDDFNILKESAQKSYELLENLLTWASSQKGDIEFKPSETHIFDLVEANIQLFEQTSEKKQINLINNVNTNIKATIDKNMINTVLRNLINNAIKYTNEKGIISINANEENNYIEVLVSDNGVGIKSTTLNKLFKIEEKNPSLKGTKGEIGSGLGLILCKEFIDKHNGTISVESEIGKGSIFKFTIPKSQ